MATIVVGYVAKPEGEAALQRAIDEAKLRNAFELDYPENYALLRAMLLAAAQ